MKVRFKGAEGFDRPISQGSGALRVGMEYPVLEILALAGDANKFRIQFSDVELPALFDSRLFEVTSGRIPPSWHIVRNRYGSLTFGPREWQEQGFWESFMDHELWAIDLYEVGRSKSLDKSA
jgi:hypothetical protein